MKKYWSTVGIKVSLLFILVLPNMALAELVTTESYYVRPALRVALGELIDGYQANGDLQSTQSQGVLGNSQSTVNLNDGTVKMYLEYFGGSSSGDLQTFGGFGERITIVGGAGTLFNVGFAVDGFFEVFGAEPIINGAQPPAFFYDAGLAVYQAGQVDYTSFVPTFNDFTPLFYRHDFFVDEIDSSLDYNFYDIFAGVQGSILLESDYEVFDIFTFTNMVVNSKMGDGLQSFVADLTQTATYQQSVANGVDVFSSSGQFLGLSAPPPPPNTGPVTNVPAPAGILFLGFSLIGLIIREKKYR